MLLRVSHWFVPPSALGPQWVPLKKKTLDRALSNIRILLRAFPSLGCDGNVPLLREACVNGAVVGTSRSVSLRRHIKSYMHSRNSIIKRLTGLSCVAIKQ